MNGQTLRIRLFGELDVSFGDTRLPPVDSARAASLVAYLALHRGAPIPREHLAYALWPDSTDAQARTNLRHVLHTLRHALPEADRILDISRTTLRLHPDACIWIDVEEFERAADSVADAAGKHDLGSAGDAIRLYAGDLLESCYDEWIIPQRERLRTMLLRTMERQALLLTQSGRSIDAVESVELLLRHDPLNEFGYRTLMELHAANGNRALAVQQYHICVATLDRELGVPPSDETSAIYEALLPEIDFAPTLDETDSQPHDPTFIGRLSERERLTALWTQLAKSGPQFVLLAGEAGIGKTRLAEDFLRYCARQGAMIASARAFRAEGALAYGPLSSWLRSGTFDGRLQRLGRPHAGDIARLLPEMSIEVQDSSRLDASSDLELRQRLFDAVASVLLGDRSPVVLLADDLQWFDRETLQFLHFLMRVEPHARLLILATLRDEELYGRNPVAELRAGLSLLDRLVEIDLVRLAPPEAAALASEISGHALSEADLQELYRETDGNPLFVIEALRAGWEQARLHGGWTSAKVQVVIERRLADISVAAQDLIGLAASIGREFDSEILAHASGVDEETLVAALDELWRRRLIREQGAVAYDFAHDKIREVALALLSPAQRRHHHVRIARTLEYLDANGTKQVSSDIARHFETAGEIRQAVSWYRRAGADALHLFATAEAISSFSHALDLLRTLPPSLERDVHELEILSSLPSPLLAHDAYASQRLTEIHARAYELSRATGIALAPPLLRSIAVSSMTRGDFETARAVGEQLRELGNAHEDDVLRVEALYVLGIGAFWTGAFLEARQCFEQAVQGYRDEDRAMHLQQYGQVPKVVCLSRLANTLWFLGRTDEALLARDSALELAEQIEHSISHATALVFAALLALDMRDLDQFKAYVSALDTTASSLDARQFRIAKPLLTCYLDVVERRDHSGIDRIWQMLRNRDEIEMAPGNILVTTRLLMAACVASGDVQGGLAAADFVLQSKDAGPWEAEIRRLRAELLVLSGAPDAEVESDLLRALDVARAQSARSFELKAYVSLHHHYQRVGNTIAAASVRLQLSSLVAELGRHGSSQDLSDARALLTLR